MSDQGCSARSPEAARDFCVPGCVVLDCLDSNSATVLSLLVPKSLTESQQSERCAAAHTFVSKQTTDKCQGGGIIQDLNTAEIVLISLIILALLCCITTIVYYNYKVSRG